jgi:DNA repair protein RadC
VKKIHSVSFDLYDEAHVQRISEDPNQKESLDDYQLLLEFFSLIYPKPKARVAAVEIVKIFGSFQAFMAAREEELNNSRQLNTDAVAFIHFFKNFVGHFNVKFNIKPQRILRLEHLERYLAPKMADLPIESARLLLLDKRNSLISDYLLANGTVSDVTIYPREVLRQAIICHVTAQPPRNCSTPSAAAPMVRGASICLT